MAQGWISDPSTVSKMTVWQKFGKCSLSPYPMNDKTFWVLDKIDLVAFSLMLYPFIKNQYNFDLLLDAVLAKY